MFVRSHLTTAELEAQRLSSPAAAAAAAVASPLRAQRYIPPELRAPAPSSDPFGPLEEMGRGGSLLDEAGPEEDEDLTAVMEEVEEGATLVGSQEPLSAQAYAASAEAPPAAAPAGVPVKARSSLIGRALFPPQRTVKPNVTSQGSPRSTRLSLPLTSTASSSSSSSAASLLPKRTSLPGPSASLSRSTTATSSSAASTSRKTTSPSHTAGRRLLSSSLPSSTSLAAPSASRDGTLLALPLAQQLHTLKSRNASLTKSLASAQADANAKLAKAAERIKQLEEAQENGKVEAEGWEAEATRLAAELAAAAPAADGASAAAAPATPAPGAKSAQQPTDDLQARLASLERQLALSEAKRRRGKEMQAKLRCELVNRRWKEKWEVELLEREERRWEVRVVELEAEVAGVKWERECERAERIEAQETLAAAQKRISTLSASRTLLLSSFSAAESTIASLRSDLAAAKKDVDDAVLAAAGAGEEVEELRAKVARLEKGERKSQEQVGKEAEKERARREKAEGEVKDLKAQLKTAQSALKAAEKTASTASASAASAESALAAALKDNKAAKDREPLARSSSTVKAASATTSRKRPAPVEEEEDDEPLTMEEEHPYAAPSPAPVKDAAAEPKKAPAKKKAAPPPPPSEDGADSDVQPAAPSDADAAEEDEVEDEEETYKPAKSKSRAVPMAKPVKLKVKADAPKAKKQPAKAEGAAEEVEEEGEGEAEDDEDRTPRPTPAPEEKPSKKRKAGAASILGDKSANTGLKVKKASAAAAAGTEEKDKKKPKKKSALVFSDDEEAAEEAKAALKAAAAGKKGGADGEPAKKKQKVKLFGAKKGFDWGGIENANMAGGLIPIDLSPVKVKKASGGGVLGKLGGGAGGAKKSIFG
ncbi:hypothetical protein JCM6882_007825 [Rhodosporidiobolus microsporus]